MGKKASLQRLDTYSGRLGAAIRSRREKLGLTVDEMAKKLASAGCRMSLNSLYKWETGQREIPVSALPALAEALNTSPRRLLPEA